MRAALLEAPRRLVVADAPEPAPAADDVVVGVELAGVCGSDAALFVGSRPASYPLILGHEAVGRIVQPGSSGLAEGTRVVVEPNIPCGRCAICRRGRGNVCPAKRSLGLNRPGAFAERIAVPAPFVHPVPDQVSLRDAVGLEPLAVAVHAFRLGGAGQGDRVAVIGCGNEGLLLVQVAVAMGAHVLAVDRRAEALETARRLGASETWQVSPAEPAAAEGARIAAQWQPLVVFESAGAAPAVELALNAPAPGGLVVLVGLAAQPVPLLPLQFVRHGLSLVGSLIYDHPRDFTATIELVAGGRIRPSALEAHVYSLAEAAAALDRVAGGASGKTLIDVGGVLADDSDRSAVAACL